MSIKSADFRSVPPNVTCTINALRNMMESVCVY